MFRLLSRMSMTANINKRDNFIFIFIRCFKNECLFSEQLQLDSTKLNVVFFVLIWVVIKYKKPIRFIIWIKFCKNDDIRRHVIWCACLLIITSMIWGYYNEIEFRSCFSYHKTWQCISLEFIPLSIDDIKKILN